MRAIIFGGMLIIRDARHLVFGCGQPVVQTILDHLDRWPRNIDPNPVTFQPLRRMDCSSAAAKRIENRIALI